MAYTRCQGRFAPISMAFLTIPALATKKLHRYQGIVLLCIYAAFCVIQFTM